MTRVAEHEVVELDAGRTRAGRAGEAAQVWPSRAQARDQRRADVARDAGDEDLHLIKAYAKCRVDARR